VARLSLPATKGNLLKIKAEHLLASEAVTFLEEKRDLLLGELLIQKRCMQRMWME